MLPVEWVNDPRIIAQHDDFVSINATTEVDLLGQCASETVAELRGRSVREQAEALIAIADPAVRDDLRQQARELRYL